MSFLRWMQNMELCFTTDGEVVGERAKTIKYRFGEAKELKQGVCRAEQAQATADDYATRVGLSNPTHASLCAIAKIVKNVFMVEIVVLLWYNKMKD